LVESRSSLSTRGWVSKKENPGRKAHPISIEKKTPVPAFAVKAIKRKSQIRIDSERRKKRKHRVPVK
jgi:hypothetical protein